MKRLMIQLIGLFLIVNTPYTLAVNAVDQSNDEYYETQRLASVISHITHLYIREVSYREMINNAIDGLLQNLDPHSAFLDEESLEQLNSQTDGKFTGVGIEVVRENGSLKVITPLDESPAKKAGIFFFSNIFLTFSLLISSMFFIYLFCISSTNLDAGVVLYPLIELNASP